VASREQGGSRAPSAPVDGYGVVWPSLGRAALEPIVVEPGLRDLVVEVSASIVSSGTERARFLGLPNARVDFPHRPGYSASGRVVAAGPAVRGVQPGQEVALLDVPHQSVACVPPERALPLPAGVPVADAAILQLALVAGLGVHRAELAPQEPHGVIGMGLIGALTQRLAQAWGAGPCTAIAKTPAKEAVAHAGGAAAFLAVERKRDAQAVEQLGLPVVVEATGDPEALALALAAAAPGGRVVLLGSPRGRAPLALLETLRHKRLRLIGVHVTRLEGTPGLGAAGAGALAVRILEALAAGTLRVADLLEEVDPREAARFYRRLVNDRQLVGARFDWTRPLDRQRTDAGVRQGRATPAPGSSAPPGAPDGAGEDRQQRAALAVMGRAVDRPLRFGFVGCGEIAVLNADAVAMAPNAAMTACYDVDAELAFDLARRHDAAVMPSLTALLERADVDAVVLSLPHHLHAPAAFEAAQAGKHVVVEKPLATNLAAAADLVRAVERAGVALSVCFPERYGAGTTRARRLVERNGLGDLFMVELLWYADKPLSYLFGGFSGRSPSPWRMRQKESGGGILLMNLCHGLDLVHHVTGLGVEYVSASVANVERLGQVEDTFAIDVKYDNGALGILAGSSAVRRLRHESLRFLGTDGWLGLRPILEVHTSRLVAGLGIDVDRRVKLGPPLPPLVTRARYFSRFASAVRLGRRPDVTGEDGLRVQAVLEAAYEAALSGARFSPADLLAERGDQPQPRPRQRRSPVEAHPPEMSGRLAT